MIGSARLLPGPAEALCGVHPNLRTTTGVHTQLRTSAVHANASISHHSAQADMHRPQTSEVTQSHSLHGRGAGLPALVTKSVSFFEFTSHKACRPLLYLCNIAKGVCLKGEPISEIQPSCHIFYH